MRKFFLEIPEPRAFLTCKIRREQPHGGGILVILGYETAPGFLTLSWSSQISNEIRWASDPRLLLWVPGYQIPGHRGCFPWFVLHSCSTWHTTPVSCFPTDRVVLLVVVQLPGCVWLFVTPHQASLSLTTSQSLSKFMFIASVMPSSHLILWRSLLLPSSFPSIRDFSSEFVLIRWPKCWSFSFSMSPSSEYSGLISLKINWFDLLAVQGTFRSLLQHHSSKASIPWCSAFFMVQLSQPYMTTGKTIALTIWTFVGRVMSLLFNTPCRFVIAFLPSEEATVFWLHGCSHRPQWLWSPQRGNLWHWLHFHNCLAWIYIINIVYMFLPPNFHIIL